MTDKRAPIGAFSILFHGLIILKTILLNTPKSKMKNIGFIPDVFKQ